MQTFMAYPDFLKSLECLDNKRLTKQRVEARQIYDVLTGKTKTKAWIHHPALLMWKGYEDALALYYNYSLALFTIRGFKNIKLTPIDIKNVIKYPSWLGDDRLHSSHRANLKRKNISFYGKYNWSESPDMPYFWPVKNNS